MTTPNENAAPGQGNGVKTNTGSALPKNDTEVARLLQRKFAVYSLIWEAVLPDLPFLEDCVHRVSVLHQPIPGDDRTRLHCLILKLFQLREALNV